MLRAGSASSLARADHLCGHGRLRRRRRRARGVHRWAALGCLRLRRRDLEAIPLGLHALERRAHALHDLRHRALQQLWPVAAEKLVWVPAQQRVLEALVLLLFGVAAPSSRHGAARRRPRHVVEAVGGVARRNLKGCERALPVRPQPGLLRGGQRVRSPAARRYDVERARHVSALLRLGPPPRAVALGGFEERLVPLDVLLEGGACRVDLEPTPAQILIPLRLGLLRGERPLAGLDQAHLHVIEKFGILLRRPRALNLDAVA
mmetsp:Transcript_50503/g.139837  ORF Transcript_50503/g.139837 Transcript_50503/m.139837 type:complete len:262 (-) Transcript_50503:26-811(-)